MRVKKQITTFLVLVILVCLTPINAFAEEIQWISISSRAGVSLDKTWTVKFSGVFSSEKIEAIVVERAGIFVPVIIKSFPLANQVVIQPVESYLPSTEYNVKIFLSNGKKYKMTFTTVDKDTVVDEERGNTVGNIINGGLVAEKDGWIYYSNPDDQGKLYKLNNTTGKKEKLGDTVTNVRYINVMGGWVYFTNEYNFDYHFYYKIRTDGTELSSVDANILHEGYANIVNRTFYSGRTNLNVSGKSKYYSDSNNKMYKCNLDDSNVVNLTTFGVSDINVVGDWIYYINLSDNKIYKIKTDGTNKISLTDDFTEDLHVADGYIYYVNSENRFMYRMRTDGTDKQQINTDASSAINIAGGWIYYVNPVNGIEYRMKLDGSDWQKVN